MDRKSIRTDAIRKLFLLPVVFSIVAFNCNNSTSTSGPLSSIPQSMPSISVINYPSPYFMFGENTTAVAITKDTITYKEDTILTTAVRDSNGKVIYYERGPDSLVMSWSKPIITSDFDAVASLIINNHIIGMSNPFHNPVLVGCGGYSLIIQLCNRTDTIGVYGCNLQQTEQLSELNEVSSCLNALAVKYSKL